MTTETVRRGAGEFVQSYPQKRSPQNSDRPLKIVMAGGGTGGHLFPGIAIASEFVRRNPASDVLFVSTGNPLERSVLAKAGFAIATLKVEGLKGRGLWRQLRALSRLPVSILQAARILVRDRPQLVIGLGSYSAGPTVLAARLMRIGIVLHEQNLLPGITNRWLGRFADRICVSFERTAKRFPPAKVLWTGNPVRADIAAQRRQPALASEGDGFTVLILGGSQGAHGINMAVVESLARLQRPEALRFIHQTGAADLEMVRHAYARYAVSAEVKPFFDDMAERYAAADLIVCRAGATTIAEITALGKAAIFVPFPHAADNHQVLNAAALADDGAAELILEENFSGAVLAERIEFLAEHTNELRRMGERVSAHGKPEAAEAIVDACYEVLRGRGVLLSSTVG